MISFSERISNDPLTPDEYYLASMMFSLGFMRYKDEPKLLIVNMISDPNTDAEKDIQKKHFEYAYSDAYVAKDMFWIEEENSPICAQQVRQVFHELKKEIGRKVNLCHNDIFKRLMSLEINVMGIADARELMRQANINAHSWNERERIDFLREPEAFRKSRGNFASMDRKRVYSKTGDKKFASMNSRSFRRKM